MLHVESTTHWHSKVGAEVNLAIQDFKYGLGSMRTELAAHPMRSRIGLIGGVLVLALGLTAVSLVANGGSQSEVSVNSNNISYTVSYLRVASSESLEWQKEAMKRFINEGFESGQGKGAKPAIVEVVPLTAPWGNGQVSDEGSALRDFPYQDQTGANKLRYRYSLPANADWMWQLEAILVWPLAEGGEIIEVWGAKLASESGIPADNNLSSPWVFGQIESSVDGQRDVSITRIPPGALLGEAIIP